LIEVNNNIISKSNVYILYNKSNSKVNSSITFYYYSYLKVEWTRMFLT